MNTGAALLRAILADPADDTARLVYADWLDENGQPERAEFIRKWIKRGGIWFADNVPHLTRDRGYDGLMDQWSRPLARESLPPPEKGSRFNAEFRCGFCSRIECTQAWFLRHAEALFRAQPVTAVTLTDCDCGDYIEGTHHPVWQQLSVTRGVWPGDWQERRYGVDDELFDLMREMPAMSPWGSQNIVPKTRIWGLEALSLACVMLGRRRAQLPALHAPNSPSKVAPASAPVGWQ